MNKNHITSLVEQKVKEGCTVYIFCAGQYGAVIAGMLKQAQLPVMGFIDNNPEKAGGMYQELPVYDSTYLKNITDAYIIVATINKNYAEEIKEQLVALKFNEDKDFYCIPNSEAGSSDIQLKEKFCLEADLVIRHTGDVYPCCRVWTNPHYRIGHIKDTDIMEKIRAYDGPCKCGLFSLKNTHEPNMVPKVLNIETSMLCQGACACCAAHAPWKTDVRPYEYFQELGNFIVKNGIKSILVQGGEVFVQEDAVQFLEDLKRKVPDLCINIITNGCFSVDKAQRFASLFSFTNTWISFMGAQRETYERVMGLDMDKTLAFIRELIVLGKKPGLSFAVIPITMHEVTAFFEMAIELGVTKVRLNDGYWRQYTTITEDHFWDKIAQRSAKKFQKYLIRERTRLLELNFKIYMHTGLIDTYEIDPAFLKENGLDQIVFFD